MSFLNFVDTMNSYDNKSLFIQYKIRMKNIYNSNQKQPHGSQGMRNVWLFKMTKNVVTIYITKREYERRQDVKARYLILNDDLNRIIILSSTIHG